MTGDPVAIIDIGSNSVRLVVYSGATRSPSVIFNEKVLAGLGEGMAETGALTEASQERALAALARFRLLIDQMGAGRRHVVATAAVREASNGAAFLERVRALGLHPALVSGEEEARLAGMGVLSAMPEADGIVGDLGGGSLELVDVAGGAIRARVSLPLGVLRVGRVKGDGALAKKVAKAVDSIDFRERGRARPFYLVGGSWRALARLDMALIDYPLPIIHHYTMSVERPAALKEEIAALGKAAARDIQISVSRLPTLPAANRILRALADELAPSGLVATGVGIREGLLFDSLPPEVRALDPLIEAAREAGRGLGRFAEHGALIDRWIAPAFGDDPAAARLRLAACLLADVAWLAHPDFRAERGVDMALHGNWVGVDGPGRVMIAQALFRNFGGGSGFADFEVAALCNPDELKQAARWGLAMRLAQRLSGGVAAGLERTALSIRENKLRLAIVPGAEALYGETVARRHKTLANALDLEPEMVVSRS